MTARIAGWWLWGSRAGLVSGWCSGRGRGLAIDGVLMDRRKVNAAARKDAPGAGRQLPYSDDGRGVGCRSCANRWTGCRGQIARYRVLTTAEASRPTRTVGIHAAPAPPAYELGRLSSNRYGHGCGGCRIGFRVVRA